MLAQRVPDHERTRTFARYSLIGALSMAAGSLAAALPDFMTSAAGFGEVTAFRIMFYVYAALGLLCAGLYSRLPHVRMDERRPSAPLGPSRRVVYKLAALFSLMRLPAALWCNRCSRCGYSSVLTCRSQQQACSFSGQAC